MDTSRVPQKEFFTQQEIAELLQCDVRTVTKMIRQGKLKALRLSRKMIRIPYASLVAIMDNQEQ